MNAPATTMTNPKELAAIPEPTAEEKQASEIFTGMKQAASELGVPLMAIKEVKIGGHAPPGTFRANSNVERDGLIRGIQVARRTFIEMGWGDGHNCHPNCVVAEIWLNHGAEEAAKACEHYRVIAEAQLVHIEDTEKARKTHAAAVKKPDAQLAKVMGAQGNKLEAQGFDALHAIDTGAPERVAEPIRVPTVPASHGEALYRVGAHLQSYWGTPDHYRCTEHTPSHLLYKETPADERAEEEFEYRDD